MKRRWLTLALLASILGIACAGLSLATYLDIHKTGIVEGSFCTIGDFINCDAVEVSSYAAINGFPIAGFGLAYYILIFVFALISRFSRGFKRPTVAFAWWTTIPAVLYSAFLGYISIHVLGSLCLTCVGMYIANLLLFFSLFFAMGMPAKEWGTFIWGYWLSIFSHAKKGIDFMPRFWMHLLVTVIFFAVGFVFVSASTGKINQVSDLEMNEYIDRFYRQSKYDLQIDKETLPMWGTKGAPVTVVEFSDYRCPFCRVAAFMVKPFLSEFKRDVALYFVNYPLDSTCNHYMKHQMHPGACLGAKAGICANKVGKFWPYHDMLFKSTGRIDDKLVNKLAQKLKIDEKVFDACLNDPETERQLANEIEAARRIYITGTPSIFVNDRHLRFWRNPYILRELVEREIHSPKKSKKNKEVIKK